MTTAELSDLLGSDLNERGSSWSTAGLPEFQPQAGEKWLCCDSIHDAGNLGSMIRSARCFGLTGVVLGPGCGDVFSRRCVRGSVGHVFMQRLAVSADPAQVIVSGNWFWNDNRCSAPQTIERTGADYSSGLVWQTVGY